MERLFYTKTELQTEKWSALILYMHLQGQKSMNFNCLLAGARKFY